MCTTVMVIGRVGEEIRDWTLESIPVATPQRMCWTASCDSSTTLRERDEELEWESSCYHYQ